MVLWRRRRRMIRAAATEKHFHIGLAQNDQRPDSDWRADQKAAGRERNDRENGRGFRPIVARPVEHLDGAVNGYWRRDKAQQEYDQHYRLTRIKTESLRFTSRSRPVTRIAYLYNPADHTIQAERSVKRSRDYQTDSRWNRIQ